MKIDCSISMDTLIEKPLDRKVSVFVNPSSAKSSYPGFEEVYENYENMLYDFYWDVLRSKNIEVITDKSKIDEKTICFNPSNKAKTYLVEKEIRESIKDKIYVPKTVSFLDFADDRFYPAVFKAQQFSCGKHKFFIKGPWQMCKFAKSVVKEIESENLDGNYFTPTVMQEYIKPITKYNVSMRVLVPSRTNEHLAAGIIWNNPRNIVTDENDYFVGAKSIQSNASKGGNIIPLHSKHSKMGKRVLSSEEKFILKKHNFDVENPCVPPYVLDVASYIATKFEPFLGNLPGIDFIFDKRNGWSFLEANCFPGTKTYFQQQEIILNKPSELEIEIMKYKMHRILRRQMDDEQAIDILRGIRSLKKKIIMKDHALSNIIQKDMEVL